MKALGLSFSVFVFAALAASQAEARFGGFFHSAPRIGPMHGGGHPNDLGRDRPNQGGGIGFVPASAAPDVAPDASPQYEPVPIPVPYRETRWVPSQPKLILIGVQQPPRGGLPKVVYGNPLPEQAAKP